MTRALQIGGLLLAATVAGFADQKGNPKPLPPARPPASRPKAQQNGGGGRNGGGQKAPLGPRLINPNSPAARLFRANPEERERAIEKFPAARQDAIRKNLAWFDRLPKPEQERLLAQTERLANLPPDKQRAFAQQMQSLNRLEPDRRQAVAIALRRLQGMSDEERSNTLNREQFKSRFSPEEFKIITDLSAVMPPM